MVAVPNTPVADCACVLIPAPLALSTYISPLPPSIPSRCNRWSEVGEDATAVLCHKCVCQTVGPPEIKGGYVSKGRPRGWQFMKEFVDPQGNVFHKGKEQPNLKGTLEPTKVDKTPKKKLSKNEKEQLRNQILQQMAMVRGSLKKARWKKDIKSGNSQLKKLERQLKKIR